MNYKDKCDLILYMINKVDTFWNRLYVSTAVIIGFLINGNLLKTSIITDLLLLGGYFIFLAGNLLDHMRAYRYLVGLIKEIQKDGDELNNDIMYQLKKLPYKYELYTCVIAYVLVLLLNISLWYFSKLY